MWPTVRPSTTTYKQYIHELDTRKYFITSLEDLGSASPTNCYWTMISDDDLEFQLLVVTSRKHNLNAKTLLQQTGRHISFMLFILLILNTLMPIKKTLITIQYNTIQYNTIQYNKHFFSFKFTCRSRKWNSRRILTDRLTMYIQLFILLYADDTAILSDSAEN